MRKININFNLKKMLTAGVGLWLVCGEANGLRPFSADKKTLSDKEKAFFICVSGFPQESLSASPPSARYFFP
ncbi:MAG: hypothetical protein E7544_02670 [Ruminococcaceae bacterium]|nr:hypothetical protein [Oscillospiraceae bacterium]